jgi:nucleotide-binding universal stress UspA family protein
VRQTSACRRSAARWELHAVRTSWCSAPNQAILNRMHEHKFVPPAWVSHPGEVETAEAADRPSRSVEDVGPFNAVLCAEDRSTTGRAARRQARLLASPGGTVEFVHTSRLTRHGPRALQGACDGYDVLVLGAGAGAYTVLRDAPIPVLVARPLPLGTELTDAILVPVDGSAESVRAVELAARLASAHGAAVTVLPTSPHDPNLARAVAASSRVLLRATGEPPAVFGGQAPPERAIPTAASTLRASLVILGCGFDTIAKSATATTAGFIGCSVLAVPHSAKTGSGRRTRRSRRPSPARRSPPVGAGAAT